MAPRAAGTETVTLGDGTSFDIARVEGVDDATWAEMKAYLEGNPEVAKKLQTFARDPEKVRGFMQTQAMSSYYQHKSEGDGSLADKMKNLETDPELAHVFAQVREAGKDGAMEKLLEICADEELMLKVSQKMGGIPGELKSVLQKIDDTPLSLHEAAKRGDLAKVQDFLTRGQAIDTQDLKGISALGYAIGSNRIAVVKCLLDGRANPHAVDAMGNSGLHYAAGYGRKELCEYLLRINANVNQSNSQGMSPLAAATSNRQTQIIELLRANGARA